MTLLDSLADDMARQSNPSEPALNPNTNAHVRPRRASEGLGARGLAGGRERSGSNAIDPEDFEMEQLEGSMSVTSARVCVEFVTINLSEKTEAMHRSFEIELRGMPRPQFGLLLFPQSHL